MFSYELELLTTTAQIEKQIEDAILEILKKEFGVDVTLVKSNLKHGIQNILRKHIENNVTFQSAIKGELLGELGLPMDRRMWAANEMIDLIGEGVEVKVNITKGTGVFDVGVDIIWSNDKIQELMFRGEASYISSSGKEGLGGGKAKHQIPWLEWLLEGGSSVLISGFHIEYGDFDNSRTHMALMKEGGQWSMPSGPFTIQNNFVTQSIERATPEIIKFVLENFK